MPRQPFDPRKTAAMRALRDEGGAPLLAGTPGQAAELNEDGVEIEPLPGFAFNFELHELASSGNPGLWQAGP